jgi:PAS domain S-box-containing protein
MARRYGSSIYKSLGRKLSTYITLIVVSAAFALSVLFSLVRVEENRYVRYASDSAAEWNVLQATAQLERFSAKLEGFMRADSGVGSDQLLDQYDLMWSRFRLLLNNPENGALNAIEAAYLDIIRIEEQLIALEPLARELRPGNADGHRQLDAFVARQRQWLTGLVQQVHAERVNVNRRLGEVGKIYEETLLLLALTMLSIATLVFQLVRAIRKADSSLRDAEAARAEAQAAQRELRTVVDAVPAMITVWDVGGRCLFANSLCAAFHGLDAERMAGRGAAELGLRGGRHRAVPEVVRTGALLPFAEHVDADAGGTRRVLLSTLVPIRDDAGGILGVVDVSLDVTERKQREVALAEARDRLERQAGEMRELAEKAQRASSAKSVFLAMMSHEIRTPMNALLGFADLLARSPLLPDQRHHVNVVRETGGQLLALLNDILDFTRSSTAGSRSSGSRSASTSSCARFARWPRCCWPRRPSPSSWHSIRTFPQRPGRSREGEAGAHQPARQRRQVHDPRPRQPRGGARAGSRARDRALLGQRHGVGIDPTRVSRLFQVFSQAEDDTHRRFGGTGLGLAICRRLVELMGGQIGGHSEPGRGSTFWFVLPLEPVAAAAHEPDAPGEAAVPPRPAAAPPRPLDVLVVDDVDTNLRLLQALVRRAGHRVAVATDGAGAVRAVGSAKPDLVLMDVNMPGMDGLEAARRIRALGGAAGRVPIVALTANAFAGDVEACRAAGMDGHLVKPIDVGALAATLARFGAAAAAVAPPGRAAPRRAAAVLDPARLDRLAGAVGDRRGGLPVPAHGARGHDGDRRDASRVGGRRPRGAAQAAHGLAGIAGSLGALRLHEAASPWNYRRGPIRPAGRGLCRHARRDRPGPPADHGGVRGLARGAVGPAAGRQRVASAERRTNGPMVSPSQTRASAASTASTQDSQVGSASRAARAPARSERRSPGSSRTRAIAARRPGTSPTGTTKPARGSSQPGHRPGRGRHHRQARGHASASAEP